MKKTVYFTDLTHTARGINARTFPLGVSLVASYVRHELADELDCRLLKLPESANQLLMSQPPDVLCMSNYSWNLELTYAFARAAKRLNPKLVTVMGGPNFPTTPEEKADFLRRYPLVDFYIQQEGEVALAQLLRHLLDDGLEAAAVKREAEPLPNCTYLVGDEIVSGSVERIDDVNIIPSPYVTGVLDEFFDAPLVPMLETTRGCPFSCTFCADGLPTKSRIHRFSEDHIAADLHYIADHVKDCDELIITDLNFGMYPQDLETCRVIARLQEERGWPKAVKASAGKNKPERIIEAAKILQGSWFLQVGVQSTDPDVLSEIKRSNISPEKLVSLVQFHQQDDALTAAELILGLPGDSKERHYASLKRLVDTGINSVRMFQLMLLSGTEVSSQESRKKHEMMVKHRAIPGNVGLYDLGGEMYRIAETEQIVVGSNTLPFADYLDCRVMDLIVEVFVNNAFFEELFGLIRGFKLSPFDCLRYLKEHPELYPASIDAIFASFVEATQADLYADRETIMNELHDEAVMQRYMTGEIGRNELLDHKAMCYFELADTHRLMYGAARAYLGAMGFLTQRVDDYLREAERFSLLRKHEFEKVDDVLCETFNYDFPALANRAFEVDPNELEPRPLRIEFWHDQEGASRVRNAARIYGIEVKGARVAAMGRLIQRSNLKDMYRRCRVVDRPTVLAVA